LGSWTDAISFLELFDSHAGRGTKKLAIVLISRNLDTMRFQQRMQVSDSISRITRSQLGNFHIQILSSYKK
jgi:hypothetical protein